MSAPFLIYKESIIGRSGLAYSAIDHDVISKDYDQIVKSGRTYTEVDIKVGAQMQQMLSGVRGEKVYSLPNARRIATKWVTI